MIGHVPTFQKFSDFFKVAPGGASRAPGNRDVQLGRRPRAGGRDPLTVRFPAPLDYAMLARVVAVVSVEAVIPRLRITDGPVAGNKNMYPAVSVEITGSNRRPQMAGALKSGPVGYISESTVTVVFE